MVRMSVYMVMMRVYMVMVVVRVMVFCVFWCNEQPSN